MVRAHSQQSVSPCSPRELLEIALGDLDTENSTSDKEFSLLVTRLEERFLLSQKIGPKDFVRFLSTAVIEDSRYSTLEKLLQRDASVALAVDEFVVRLVGRGDKEIVASLLSLPSYTCSLVSHELLLAAVKGGSAELVNYFKSVYDIESAYIQDELLYVAVRSGNTGVLDILLQECGQLDATVWHDLIAAAVDSRSVATLTCLVEATNNLTLPPLDLLVQEKLKPTPVNTLLLDAILESSHLTHEFCQYFTLPYYAFRGRLEKVRELIDNGLNPSVDNNIGLFLALKEGHAEVANELLADDRVNRESVLSRITDRELEWGMAALDLDLLPESVAYSDHNVKYKVAYSIQAGDVAALRVLSQSQSLDLKRVTDFIVECLDWLPSFAMFCEADSTKHKMNLSTIVNYLFNEMQIDTSHYGYDLLRHAIRADDISLVQTLLNDKKLRVSDFLIAALKEAVLTGNQEIMKLLLADSRARPEISATRNSRTSSLLTLAAKDGQSDMVKVLLDDGRLDPGLGENDAVKALFNWNFDPDPNCQIIGEPVDHRLKKEDYTGSLLHFIQDERVDLNLLRPDLLSRAVNGRGIGVVALLLDHIDFSPEELQDALLVSAKKIQSRRDVEAFDLLASHPSVDLTFNNNELLATCISRGNFKAAELVLSSKNINVTECLQSALWKSILEPEAGEDLLEIDLDEEVFQLPPAPDELSEVVTTKSNNLLYLYSFLSSTKELMKLIPDRGLFNQVKGDLKSRLADLPQANPFLRVVYRVFEFSATLARNEREAFDLAQFVLLETIKEKYNLGDRGTSSLEAGPSWNDYLLSLDSRNTALDVRDFLDQFRDLVYVPYMAHNFSAKVVDVSYAELFKVVFNNCGLLDVLRFNHVWHRNDINIPEEVAKVTLGGSWYQLLETGTYDVTEVLRFEELDDFSDLYSEGRDMNHCIAQYAPKCCRGLIHVFSLQDTESGQKLATVAIALYPDLVDGTQHAVLEEVKGPNNSEVDVQVLDCVELLLGHLNSDDRLKNKVVGETAQSREKRSVLSDFQLRYGVREGEIPWRMLLYYQYEFFYGNKNDGARFLKFNDALEAIVSNQIERLPNINLDSV